MPDPDDLTEREKQALVFASETAKQFLTLSAAILGVSITFMTDMPVGAGGNKHLLIAAWAFYGLTILSGMWTLMALTGEFEPVKQMTRRPSIRGRNVTLPATLQFLTFGIGTILIFVFGMQMLLDGSGVALGPPSPRPAGLPAEATPIAAP